MSEDEICKNFFSRLENEKKSFHTFPYFSRLRTNPAFTVLLRLVRIIKLCDVRMRCVCKLDI